MKEPNKSGRGHLSPGGSPPARVTLSGRVATLTPLDAGEHARDLFEGARGHDDLWTYLFDDPYRDIDAFTAAIESRARAADRTYFAIIDNASQRALGYLCLMRADVPNRVIEVGDILCTPSLQRTTAATEAQYLLARYVFETLGYRRYEWKCNNLNEPSKRAARRLGFTFEGVFRQHMIVKSTNRDTAWFSMLDHEWPARRAAFEHWLAPDNFDASGRQKQALLAFGEGVASAI